MSDYISRQAAIDKFEPWLKVEGYSEGERNMLKATLYELRIMPTADVVPVVHGRWEEREVTDDLGAKVITEWQSCKCSVCGKYLTTPYMYFFTGYAYCPNCGASMMDGGEDARRTE